MVRMEQKNTINDRTWFFFTIFFVVLDYSRLYQELGLEVIRPLMLLNFVFIYFLLTKGKAFLFDIKQVKLIWMFIVLLFLLVLFALNNRAAFNTALSMLLYMPYMLSVINTVNTFKRIKVFVFFQILLLLYISIYAIIHDGYGPGNYFNDENDLSLYINIFLPFCFFLVLGEEKFFHKLVYIAALGLGLLSVVVSFSRGGFIGLLAVGATSWLLSKKKILSLVVITTLASILFVFGSDKYWSEMGTLTDTGENTAKERLLTWGAAARMFSANPIGVGGNNFQVRFPEYQSDEHTRVMWGRVAHSLWFTLLPETGFIGVIIYLFLLYECIKDAINLSRIQLQDPTKTRYFNKLGICFLTAFAGYFASASFISVLYYAHYWYLIALLVATKKVYAKEKSCEV